MYISLFEELDLAKSTRGWVSNHVHVVLERMLNLTQASRVFVGGFDSQVEGSHVRLMKRSSNSLGLLSRYTDASVMS